MLSLQVVDHSFDAVFHEGDVPIEQKTQFQVGELEVCQKLCLVDRQKLFNGFVFDDYGFVDQHVDSEAQVDSYLFIRDRHRHLTGDGVAGFLEFIGEASLVDGFEQAWAEGLVYLDGAVDDGFGYVFNIFHLSFF